MADEQSQITLNSYTTIYNNSRYDSLTKSDGTTGVSEITTYEHAMPNLYYRNYGTYRHSIFTADLLTKLNETNIEEKDIKDTFYDIDTLLDIGIKDIQQNYYMFPGRVNSNIYATNSNEASLEDIFVAFGYDYIKALNDSSTSYKYFDTESEETDFKDGQYQIINIGETYIDYDNDEKEEIIEYDGTYVPTVKELLDGNLYIVIQSGTLKPKKIYFNNNYLPSLFINDDKYLDHVDRYIINDNQTIRLCDLQLYQRISMKIIWFNLITINKTSIENLKAVLTNKNIDVSNVSLRPFYKIYVDFFDSTKYTNTRFIATGILDNQFSSQTYLLSNANQLSDHGDYYSYDFNGGKIKEITISDLLPDNSLTALDQKVRITVKFGLTVILNGYSISSESEPTPTPTSDTYNLSWNKITKKTDEQDEPTSQTINVECWPWIDQSQGTSSFLFYYVVYFDIGENNDDIRQEIMTKIFNDYGNDLAFDNGKEYEKYIRISTQNSATNYNTAYSKLVVETCSDQNDGTYEISLNSSYKKKNSILVAKQLISYTSTYWNNADTGEQTMGSIGDGTKMYINNELIEDLCTDVFTEDEEISVNNTTYKLNFAKSTRLWCKWVYNENTSKWESDY